MSNPCWAIVPAAGIGQRMAADVPKQYLPLVGKTVIDFTLKVLCETAQIKKIIVALRKNDNYFANTEYATHPKIITTLGGVERQDSVLAGLIALQQWSQPDDGVIVHDAVRPCLKPHDLHHLLAQFNHAEGVILAKPVTDTLKQADAEKQILNTIPRQNLWHALTPQLFRYKDLRKALEFIKARQLTVTDEAEAMEKIGIKTKLLSGDPTNIKITYPEDLLLAEFLLKFKCEEY